jgi:hypothetical protein
VTVRRTSCASTPPTITRLQADCSTDTNGSSAMFMQHSECDLQLQLLKIALVSNRLHSHAQNVSPTATFSVLHAMFAGLGCKRLWHHSQASSQHLALLHLGRCWPLQRVPYQVCGLQCLVAWAGLAALARCCWMLLGGRWMRQEMSSPMQQGRPSQQA